jgi:hypothetical protein
VPGPKIRHKDERVSIDDSSQGSSWTFVDLTPAPLRSPIATLSMPQGSVALNNTANGDRYVLPDRPLRTAPVDKAPTLDSTTIGLGVAKLREEAATPMRHDGHRGFVYHVETFAKDALPIDVVVFLDSWESPSLSDAPPPAPKDDLEAFTQGSRPTKMFHSGFAIARAFAWSPTKQELLCSSAAFAENSPGISARSNDVAPLEQDLVLQLEKNLEQSFVAVGDAPPRIEPPPPAPAEPSAAPAESAKPTSNKRAHHG